VNAKVVAMERASVLCSRLVGGERVALFSSTAIWWQRLPPKQNIPNAFEQNIPNAFEQWKEKTSYVDITNTP
jgi:hypothetical protein